MSMFKSSLAGALLLLPLVAQAAPPSSPEDLEPAVDTSHLAPQGSAPAPAPALPASASASAPAASASAATTKGSKRQAANTATQDAGSRKTMDRLELDASKVTGNSELPKVMYVVPWKRSDLGDGVGRPANSLIDEVLQPVDRDVFNRENRYYEGLPQAPANQAESKDTGDKDASAPKGHE